MTQPTYPSRVDAHKDGWFSRRHQTAAAHQDAQKQRRERRQQKLDSAKLRQELAAKRSSKERLLRLDALKLQARKERARLEVKN